jgi:RES domain-containing protein
MADAGWCRTYVNRQTGRIKQVFKWGVARQMVPANVYAALELSTAWAEYNQGFVQHPALIARLELHGGKIADLTDEASLERLAISADIHKCEWRAMLDDGQEPPTHVLRRRLIEDGVDGVIYPSFMSPGGRCLALWRWNGPGEPRLEIVDPEGRLPKTPASWL